jgi:hypothetical protein
MMKMKGLLSIVASFAVLSLNSANAGVFNIPNFINPGESAFGVEPEVNLSNESGFATNFRFQHGLSTLSNLHVLVGTGTGQRQFRVGGVYTFDFFPDVGEQPGIGLGVQGVYYRYHGSYGQLETSAIPYIHKAFDDGKGHILEPFLSFPMGFEFRSGTYDFIATLAFGAKFLPEKESKFSFIGELGLNMSNTETYVSGGVVYTP